MYVIKEPILKGTHILSGFCPHKLRDGYSTEDFSVALDPLKANLRFHRYNDAKFINLSIQIIS